MRDGEEKEKDRAHYPRESAIAGGGGGGGGGDVEGEGDLKGTRTGVVDLSAAMCALGKGERGGTGGRRLGSGDVAVMADVLVMCC
jgi:hypothetical protein